MSTLSVCKRCGHSLPSDAPQGQCPRCLLGGDEAEDTSWWQRGTAGSGHAFVPPRVEQLAEYFPQFEILEMLGRGGMGAVYLARQKTLQRLVAVKILPPEIAATPGFEERFVREGQALAKLNHPGIVGVYDFGKTGPFAYLVLEYVEGVSLRTLLRDGHLPPAEALQVVPQLCDALQAAHGRGIIHRDIKPENILLTIDGRVKIADFGVAKLAQPDTPSTTRSGGIVGTFQYMAPEQLERPGEVDHRADIYSLGVVFYEMLTGGLPLGRFPSPSQCSGVNPGLDRIVHRALEKQPEMRYAAAAHIRTDVESLEPGTPVKPATGGPAVGERYEPWPSPDDVSPVARYARAARDAAAELLRTLHPIARRLVDWIHQRSRDLAAWLGRLAPTVLLGIAGLVMVLLGLLFASGTHSDGGILFALLFGCGAGLAMLRVALAIIGEHRPTVAERFVVVYPMRLFVAGLVLVAIGWPVVVGIGFSVGALDELRRTPPLWLDTAGEVLFAATGGTLLAVGINTAVLVLIALFFPALVSALVRPYTIRLGKILSLLILCGAIAAGTLGGMMVYDVAQSAFRYDSHEPLGDRIERSERIKILRQEGLQYAY